MRKLILFLLIPCFSLASGACSTTPPKNIKNACEIFKEKRSWLKSARESYKKHGVPIHVQLAILHKESRFRHDAKPPRTKLLWLVPWTRPSSAYGYAQVLDETWESYKEQTGKWFVDRDDFGDAVDFIGWYGNLSAQRLNISKWDAYNQYLAYHEGHGGFQRKTYKNKKWLIAGANKVKKLASEYSEQLSVCKSSL